MVLARYLLRRFFVNTFAINIGITLLFNLVELFEKMIRAQPTSAIIYFIALSLAPTFFENLPISTWLASCLTLKEMEQQHEWSTLKLLNIKATHIISLILIAGISISLISLVGKEIATHQIAKKAETFKQETLKHKNHKTFFNKWFMIHERKFCHAQYVDLKTHTGTHISILDLSSAFQIKQVITAPAFTLDPSKKEIIIPQGTKLDTLKKEQSAIQNQAFFMPGFFAQLQIEHDSLSLPRVFQLLAFEGKALPNPIYHQLLYNFLDRILYHFLSLLYALLTFLLFFFFSHASVYHTSVTHTSIRHAGIYRWLAIFTPYPAGVLLFTVTHSLMKTFQYGILALLPYLILTLLITIFFSLIKDIC